MMLKRPLTFVKVRVSNCSQLNFKMPIREKLMYLISALVNFVIKKMTTTSLDDRALSLLHVKDKSSISNKAFHELASIVPALLPKCGQVKKFP